MNKSILCVVLTAFLAASSALAQTVRVQVWRHDNGCSPCCGGVEIDETFPGGQNRSFQLSSCAIKVVITTSSSSVNIGRLTFTGGPGAWPLEISLGSSFSQAGLPPTPVGNNWAGLDASDIAQARFYGGVGGNLTGSIIVPELFRFDAGGSIDSLIHADVAGNGGMFFIRAGSIPSNASITLASGPIYQVETTSGEWGVRSRPKTAQFSESRYRGI